MGTACLALFDACSCRGSTRYMPKLNLEWQDGTGHTGINIGVDAGRAPAVGTGIRLRRDPVTGQAWWVGEPGCDPRGTAAAGCD